jgi:glycine oxidase
LPDVVIVGGGIIGCATAFYLAREGASVTVLERGEIAGEASGAAAGMLAALSGEAGERGPEFDALCASSQAMYDGLWPDVDATGIDVRHRRSGVLHVALTDAEAQTLRDHADAATRLGEGGRWLDQAALLKEEPELNARAVAGYLTPDEQYVDPQRLTQALAEAARLRGVTIVDHAPVTRFRRGGGRITRVSTAATDYECQTLLLAAGPWTTALAQSLGARVPIRPVRGQMLSLEGPAAPLNHMIWGANAYLVPREDGQTYVGATVEEVGFRKWTTFAGNMPQRRAAEALVPGFLGAEIRREWAGLRPASLDGLPVMGRLPGWSNVWVSTGHFRNGILLAPASGRLVASSILRNEADPKLAPFTPNRFLD